MAINLVTTAYKQPDDTSAEFSSIVLRCSDGSGKVVTDDDGNELRYQLYVDSSGSLGVIKLAALPPP